MSSRLAVGFFWVAALAASFGVAPVVAAEPQPPESATGSSLSEAIRAELGNTSRRWIGSARIRASYPQRLSVGLGVLTARLPRAHECAGLAGGQLGIGYARVIGERRGGSPFLTHVYLGWGVRAVVLRTWGEASVTPANQTLAGVEGQFSVARASFSLGVLQRVSPGDVDGDGKRVLITGGIGWGF